MADYIAADPGIRRRWLVVAIALAIAWYLLLFPVATALYGPPGVAPDGQAQAARLVYEEAVKIALLLVPVLVAGWVGTKTLAGRTFPPPGTRVPMRLSITRGGPAVATGIALLAGALATVVFRALSLRVSLELAALLRRAG
jgi:hypothetical protein